jgi:hypothetical protein
VCWLGSFHAL